MGVGGAAAMASLLLTITISAAAQKSGDKKSDSGAEEKTRHRLPDYYADLVDDKQRQEIYDIQDEYGPKIDKLKDELQAMIEERDAKCEKVLTPDQRKKVKELTDAADAKKDSDDSKKTKSDSSKTEKPKSGSSKTDKPKTEKSKSEKPKSDKP